jgi:hypothetical protein
LRKAVKAADQALGSLRLKKHPDKTFIGQIGKRFDFLGYHFSPEGPECGQGDPEAVRLKRNPGL